jgi:hypothetical protein
MLIDDGDSNITPLPAGVRYDDQKVPILSQSPMNIGLDANMRHTSHKHQMIL